jgi:O-antigen/teichoic acid export membrane protein
LIPFKTSLVEIKDLIGLGVPLLLANLCSTLILSLDRQFVNVLFSNEEYAQYAFAYSMLSLITVATSAVSTVLYPVLKRTDDKHLKNQYDRMLSSVTVVVSVMIAAYFPLYLIIVWFLPKYSLAIAILRIIIPGIAVSSAITVVMHNYYKSFGINKVFFRKSIIILLISAAANFVAYSIWGSMEAISYASVVVIVIWYCYANSGLSNYCKSKLIKNLLYIIAVIFLFWTITEFFYNYIGFILYLCTIFIVSILFYRNYIFSVMRSLKRKND